MSTETPLPGAGVTPRGFATYASFTDLYGSKVSVQQSSLATEDAVWIFAGDSQDAPHLSVEQARWVRDALTTFIDQAEATP